MSIKSLFCSILAAPIFLLAISTADAAKTYRLYGDALAGSRFKQVEVESKIPFDKPYSALNNQQKTLFRANYSVLKASETPPYPADGTEEIYRQLIKANLTYGMPGNLFLIANVNESGSVDSVAVYETPGPEITKFATALMLATKFDPAMCDGKACKMEFPFEFNLRALKPEEKAFTKR